MYNRPTSFLQTSTRDCLHIVFRLPFITMSKMDSCVASIMMGYNSQQYEIADDTIYSFIFVCLGLQTSKATSRSPSKDFCNQRCIVVKNVYKMPTIIEQYGI